MIKARILVGQDTGKICSVLESYPVGELDIEEVFELRMTETCRTRYKKSELEFIRREVINE